MKALLVKANGYVEYVEIRKGLPALNKAVGGYIEAITLDSKLTMTMFINEAGKINKLPFNKFATDIYRAYLPTNDYVAGDAIILGLDEEGGSCTLTEEQKNEILIKSIGKGFDENIN